MKPAGMLAYYVERFATVEVNNTFYRMPTGEAVDGVGGDGAGRFPFVLKAPQRITHFGRLRDVDEPVRHFCDTARLLGDKLGPLLFQLPPNFKVDAGRLRRPAGAAAARRARGLRVPQRVVVRRTTSTPRLAATNAALCIADNDDGATPAVATADWGYLRLRAAGYSDDDLARLARHHAPHRRRLARRVRLLQARGRGHGPRLAFRPAPARFGVG